MRFLQRHAEIIVTVCIVLSVVLGATLMWLVRDRAQPAPRIEATASAPQTPSPEK